MRYEELTIKGRSTVLEVFRSGKTVDKLFVLDGCQDGPMRTIVREAKKHGAIVDYVTKKHLDQMSKAGKHQGVIASVATYGYVEVGDMLKAAEEKRKPPFLILLGEIEDPHDLGVIIRTTNLTGAHGVIIPKRRAMRLTATVVRTSAGVLNYIPVTRVTNLTAAMEGLKKKGMWFVCTDMGGEVMYKVNLKGPIGLVIGNEGEDMSKLMSERCDMTASIPTKGDIDSLNVSVATGVLAYEIVEQRTMA